MGLIHADIAEVFERQQMHDEAIVNYLKGISYNNAIGNKRSQASLYTGVANAYLQTDNVSKCKLYLDSSLQVISMTQKKKILKIIIKFKVIILKRQAIIPALKSLDLYTVYKDSLLNEENQKPLQICKPNMM